MFMGLAPKLENGGTCLFPLCLNLKLAGLTGLVDG
jgi:hypothetical protein